MKVFSCMHGTGVNITQDVICAAVTRMHRTVEALKIERYLKIIISLCFN